ncbi:unnamed protein product [Angiostrongylus costaricensis]|uniref:Kinesin motor domain-containing protein n=1 Tax=Angiostrongylus costaricensis TaxID=334426 RepID=A0A0R3PRM6_ANGCS|nr:unnamed protein product [Angiostrongylus costaricensis]
MLICIGVFHPGVRHASEKDKVRCFPSGGDETTPPIHDVYNTDVKLFLGTRDNRGVGDVSVLINTGVAIDTDSLKQLTTRIERLRLKISGYTAALRIFVVYAPSSSYDEEEAFYMDFEKFCIKDYTFFKVTIEGFIAEI